MMVNFILRFKFFSYKQINKVFDFFLFFSVGMFLPISSTFAETKDSDLSLGSVASNFLVPISGAAHFLIVGSYILGAAFLIASLARYVEYKRNPLQTRLSQVVFLFILGLFLILLPFLADYSSASASVGLKPK